MSTIKTPKASPALDLDDVRDRLQQIRDDLGAAYRERGSAIEAMLLGAIAGANVLLVGPPGTAKSALFDGFLGSLAGARTFRRVLTKFATEDDVFGPVKLSALKNDLLERNLDGRLAAVECAFVDEVFKGSDSVLNTLLEAMNERRYQGRQIPLRMLVGATNELPQDEILAAMFDRFLLRETVDYLRDDAAWMDLVASPPTYTPAASLTVAEWDAVRADAERVVLPRPVVEKMLAVRRDLTKAGIVVSDRRWVQATRVLRAAAWLEGCPEVELDHLSVLRYVLWTTVAERVQVAAVLAAIAEGPVADVARIVDEAMRAWEARPTAPDQYRAALPALATKIAKATEDIDAIVGKGIGKAAQTRIGRQRATLDAAYAQIQGDLAARFRLGAAARPARAPAP